MMRIKLTILLLGAMLGMAAGAQHAPAGSLVLEPANNDVTDIESLQRGAKYFVNYCLGCHSAEYVRYNRLGEDLGLTEDELIENLMFSGESPFDMMSNAMRPGDAARWFGVAPPDLSLIARSRGTDYLFNFLRGFYADDSTATGANNLWLENTAMPHVLWQLQGIRGLAGAESAESEEGPHLELIQSGELGEEAFDEVVRDIVNFLDYIGEPMQARREALGVRVIAFLLLFLVLSYMLKREIWRDVH